MKICWLLKKTLMMSFVFTVIILYILKNLPKTRKRRHFSNEKIVEKEVNLQISIIIVVDDLRSIKEDYSISIPTVKCYAQAYGYELLIIDFSNKTSFPEKCNFKCLHCPRTLAGSAEVKFGRHCIVAEYLRDNPSVDYVLALDADTGVVNPHHRIEDYINSSFDLTFHERRYNYEIQAATYIAKNSEFSHHFLNLWTAMLKQIPITIKNADNPAFHQLLMEQNHNNSVIKFECKSLWKNARSHIDIKKFIYCTRLFLKFDKPNCCNNRIRFYLADNFENPAWSRDGWLTKTKFSDKDFMFHDWKTKDLSHHKLRLRSHWTNPFSKKAFLHQNCTKDNLDQQWQYKTGYKICQADLTNLLAISQTKWRRKFRFRFLRNIKHQ